MKTIVKISVPCVPVVSKRKDISRATRKRAIEESVKGVLRALKQEQLLPH